MCGVGVPSVHILMGGAELRQAMVGAPCLAIHLTVVSWYGMLMSGPVGLEVQGCSKLGIPDDADQAPMLLGAHRAEVSGLVKPLLGVGRAVVRHRH
jgi:hypothetical protein